MPEDFATETAIGFEHCLGLPAGRAMLHDLVVHTPQREFKTRNQIHSLASLLYGKVMFETSLRCEISTTQGKLARQMIKRELVERSKVAAKAQAAKSPKRSYGQGCKNASPTGKSDSEN